MRKTWLSVAGVILLSPLSGSGGNLSIGYASSGLFAIAVLLLLAGYAFYISLGGQKLFEGKLLEE